MHPLHRMPFEIMTAILLQLFPSETGVEHTLKRLCLVCRHWNNFVMRCSALWAEYRYNEADSFPYFFNTCLRRSDPLPLTLYFQKGDTNSMLRSLKPHARRVRSLSYVGSDVGAIDPFTSAALNLTVKFHLMSWGDFDGAVNTDRNLQIRTGEPMQSLDLSYISVTHWSWGRMTKLVELTLNSVTSLAPSFFSRLLQTITASTGLQRLILCRLISEEPEEIPGNESSERTILLPSLQELRLAGLPAQLTEAIISRLHADRCRAIEICDELSQALMFDWLSQTLADRIQKSRTIKLRLGSHPIHGYSLGLWDGPDGDMSLYTCAIDAEGRAGRISSFARLFKFAGYDAPITLSLEGDRGPRPLVFDVPGSELEELGELSHIQADRSIDLSVLLDDLMSEGHGDWGWPCPDLQSIEMATCSDQLYESMSKSQATRRWRVTPTPREKGEPVVLSAE